MVTQFQTSKAVTAWASYGAARIVYGPWRLAVSQTRAFLQRVMGACSLLAARIALSGSAYFTGVIVLAALTALAQLIQVSSGCATASRSPSAKTTYERALAGVWYSNDTADGAASGTLILRRDRKAKLEPARQGAAAFLPLEGTWSATAQTLHIEIPNRGGADLHYTLTDHGRTLDVIYQNGMRQRFRQHSPHPAGRRRT
jgi:hypothetical protein